MCYRRFTSLYSPRIVIWLNSISPSPYWEHPLNHCSGGSSDVFSIIAHYRLIFTLNFVSMYSVVLYYIVRKYWKNWLNWPLQESTFHCIFNNHIFSFGVFRLDQLLYQAINLDNGLSNSTDLSEASEWDVAITEIRAQLYMLSGHLLLRMANEVCCFVCLCNVSKIFPSRFLSPECSSNYSTVTIEFVYLSMWLWSPSGSIIKEITPAFLSQFLHDEKCALTNSRSLKL